jgi:serine protease Do
MEVYFMKSILLPIFFSLTAFTTYAQAPKMPALKFSDPLPANAFVELAKAINPAVVNISTSTMPKMRPGGRGGYRDPFFDMLEQFYGFRMMPQDQNNRQAPMQALGTGFIIREDGLIVTNNHVIEGADVINVQLSEKSSKVYEAKLIGSDQRTDIALIKIVGNEKFPVAQLGNSKDLEVGEWVAAFGNPFGQGHTMTKGIISAKGREIGEINRFPLIQTDAPINPGNSGGPLVNMKGLVIGVNSAIDARAQGIGFAIPIDDLKEIIPQLEKNGRIKRGYIGVTLDDLNPQAAMYLGLKDDKGALITSVDPKGPAGRGGMRTYDVVTEFNGRKIERVLDLTDAVGGAKIGSEAKVQVLREGKNRTLSINITDRPDDAKLRTLPANTKKQMGGMDAPYDLGFKIADMNPQLKKEFDLSDEVGNHPVVIAVAQAGKAAMGGLMAGDVILEVNRKEVTSAAEIKKQILKGTNTFRVSRGEGFLILVF